MATDVVDHICQILIGDSCREDQIIWPLEQDGEFSVKSAYHSTFKLNWAAVKTINFTCNWSINMKDYVGVMLYAED